MDLQGLSKFACTLGNKGETKWKKAPSPSSFNKKDPRNEARTNQRPNESPFTGPDRPALDPSAVYAVLPPTPHSPITSNSPPRREGHHPVANIPVGSASIGFMLSLDCG